MDLEIVMLGAGTSNGVPVIACECPVCTSGDPRNQRTRPSVALTWQYDGSPCTVVVDTGPEFRLQVLAAGLKRLDAVLFTHSHADHIFGLDDVRAFNFLQGRAMPCYGSEETLRTVRRSFAYVFEETQEGGGKPSLELLPVREPFELLGRTVVPVPVLHGALEVFGYRFGRFAYVTDCSEIPEASFALLEGVEMLILDALRYHPHPTHFTVEQALEAAQRIGARRTVFTHMNHDVDYRRPQVTLPEGIEFGYDGLRIVLP
ncbi:MAG: MBL fold metallo-hydrolase [Acidobacteria bacterium]|nr:MBL fold metallo-hydrolase [Acidobacteriota bacterium]